MEAIITARQGAGMCQVASNEVMIVGGFNGKFLSDYYIIGCDEDTGQPARLKKFENNTMQNNQTLFPFQVPTVGDSVKGEAYSIDWQNMTLYHYSNNQWKYKMHVK